LWQHPLTLLFVTINVPAKLQARAVHNTAQARAFLTGIVAQIAETFAQPVRESMQLLQTGKAACQNYRR